MIDWTLIALLPISRDNTPENKISMQYLGNVGTRWSPLHSRVQTGRESSRVVESTLAST